MMNTFFYSPQYRGQPFFNLHGMELIDLHHQKTHGGSMRYVLAKKGAYKPNPRVFDTLKEERKLGLDNFINLSNFQIKLKNQKKI